MSKSLHSEIMFWLLSFTISTIAILAYVSYYTLEKKEAIQNSLRNVNTLENLCFKELKLHNDFLNQESIEPQFFITKKSSLIVQYNKVDENIDKIIDELTIDKLAEKPDIRLHLQNVQHYFSIDKIIFDSIYHLLIKRGFKDWGIEGKMRNYAHLLEKYDENDKVTVLQLRRREKDFILRLDTNYIPMVRFYAQSLITNSQFPKNNDSINHYAQMYLVYFNILVNCELKLGLRNNSGLIKSANYNFNLLEKEIKLIEQIFQTEQKVLYRNQLIYYSIILLLLIFLSILLSYYIARKISDPFKLLSIHINKFVHSGFNLNETLSFESYNSEFKILNYNFTKMQSEIIDYLNYFKKKVDERTCEIKQKMEEIENQKNLIEHQNTILELNNKNITDSIKYAERIQQSMLPDEETVQTIVPDCFIFYKAKDIVSGDFYFIDIINESNTNKLIFVAADGTGHGVPGAFMSLLGLNTIFRTIYGLGKTSPQTVLTVLNQSIIQILRKKSNKHNITDSMDIAFCKIDIENRKLEFIGAYRPCFIIRKNELIELKGNDISIGSEPISESSLIKHEVDLEKDDCIYIFTDGYYDQFGGKLNKKFKKSLFVNLLKSISIYDMQKQKTILEKEFIDWKGKYPQTDDVLVMGLKIK